MDFLGSILGNKWVIIGLLVVVFFYSLKVLRWLIHHVMEKTSTKNLVYLKIELPRNDSQKDRQEEVEKDFKEKIGIMSQFFRSMHEVSELNLGNRVRVWLFQLDTLHFEIFCEKSLIEFRVCTYKEYQDLLEKQITSYYPSASIDVYEPKDLRKKGYHTRGYFAYLSKLNWYPIKLYKEIENDPLNVITNALSKLKEDEIASIQMTIQPASNKWQKEANAFGNELFKGKKPMAGGFLRKIPVLGYINSVIVGLLFGVDKVKPVDTNAPGASSGDSYVRMLQTDEDLAKSVGSKAAQVGFNTVIRIFATTASKDRTIQVLNSIFVAFNSLKAANSNWFQMRRIIPLDFINNKLMVNSYVNKFFKFGEKESLLVPDELANVIHFPDSIYNFTPSIKWLQYKVLPSPPDTPREGLYLGDNIYRGDRTKVHMLRDDRTRHFYIIGKSGAGKSVFLTFMARQDVWNGDGVCVIDPHGDLIEDVLTYVPKERAKDVVLFDPADQTRPVGLNILEATDPAQMDMASSQATEIFIKLFGDEIFGPRIQHYFRNACLTLMESPEDGATLIDVPRIFTDEAFLKSKIKKIKNPVVKSFWEHEYANTGERERQEMIPYFSSKFGPFITNSIMRNTIGQAKSGFNVREIMDNKKILLINLSKGKIGDLNTQLLGLIIVAQIQMAAMSRADMPKDQRKDFYLYVDEFQNFATDSFATILSEARKYRLNLIMAHQYINQLVVSKFGNTSSAIKDAVFGNVGTMMSFKVGAEDAEYLAKEYAPVLSEQDVINIANYKAYLKLNINNTTSRPFSLQTIYDTSRANEELAQKIKEIAKLRYGRKREFVEKEIGFRIGFDF